MSQGFDSEPHSQDGQSCPSNLFGITSYEELQTIEAIYVPKRALQLHMKGMQGGFDAVHLRKIHWYLFRDVFPWAGELRAVGLSKVGGAPFANPLYISGALDDLFLKLKQEEHLCGLETSAFAQRAAYYLGEINAVHPFREGNGRTQREFIRQLCLHAGHKLTWATLDQQNNIVASVLSHTKGDHTALATIITAAIADAARRRQTP